MIDKEILTLEDIVSILGLEASKIQALMEEGTLPGLQISGECFTTKRQFLEYVANGPLPEVKEAPTVKRQPAPTNFCSNIGTNAWECKSCASYNEPLRVECLNCGYVRSVPLIDFADHSLPKLEISDGRN
jgi:hypothetical protein